MIDEADLRSLEQNLDGLVEQDQPWSMPRQLMQCRRAVFVGDLIDRGPAQLRILDIVKLMVDSGSAQVVMGNHEFNAIAYATAESTDVPSLMLD